MLRSCGFGMPLIINPRRAACRKQLRAHSGHRSSGLRRHGASASTLTGRYGPLGSLPSPHALIPLRIIFPPSTLDRARDLLQLINNVRLGFRSVSQASGPREAVLESCSVDEDTRRDKSPGDQCRGAGCVLGMVSPRGKSRIQRRVSSIGGWPGRVGWAAYGRVTWDMGDWP
jgi:hypothetical protein